MRLNIFILFLFTITVVFGQRGKIEFDKEVPKYVESLWEPKSSFKTIDFKCNLENIKKTVAFFDELNKEMSHLLSIEFLANPSNNVLVANYLNTSLNGILLSQNFEPSVTNRF